MCVKKLIFIIWVMVTVGCTTKTKEKVAGQNMNPPTAAWVENASLYEVNVRQYTPEGTFNAFAEHLPRLKELGVDILWFMPVTPISGKNRKGSLGSYYAVRDYRGINPEYGTMEDFKFLVKKAHDLGFKVILDWVANHTGWDNPMIEQHPDWYTQKEGKIISPVPDWSDVADLNYDNREMRTYMIESMKFWLQEADVDGFRCDMAAMVPTDFWEEARVALDSVKPVFMLAEAWEPELTRKAFDACYGWDLHHLMNDLAQGKKEGSALVDYFQRIDTLYPERTIILNFIDNHDENSWAGTIKERMGDAHKVYAVMSYTVPGMPLIYSGQEAQSDKRLAFFDKDQIDWSGISDWSEFYGRLNHLKQNYPALDAGLHKGSFSILKHSNEKEVFAFRRQKNEQEIIVVLNLSAKEQEMTPEQKLEGEYKDYFTDEIFAAIENIHLQPYGWKILIKK